MVVFFLSLFALSVLVSALLMVIGQTVLALFKEKLESQRAFSCKVFYEFMTGFVVVAVVRSLFGSGFQTINVLFAVPVLFWAIGLTRGERHFTKFSLQLRIRPNKTHLYLLLSFLLIFTLNFFFLYSPSGSFKIPSEDLLFYSKLSKALALYGKENLLFSGNHPVFPNQPGVFLYHFLDLWFNAVFLDLGIFSSYVSLYFITIPILIFAVYVGIVALWEQYQAITPSRLAISVLLLFTCGLMYKFYGRFVYMSNTIPGFTNTMAFTFYGRKLVVVSAFALLAANLYISGQKHLAIQAILLTTAVYSSGTFIGLIGGMGLLASISFLFGKRCPALFHIESRSKWFIVVFSLAFVLFAYFNQQPGNYDSFYTHSLLQFSTGIGYWQKVQSAFAVVFYASLFFAFCYAAYFLTFLFHRESTGNRFGRLSQFILIVGLALTAGLCGLFVFYTQLDARQFFTNLLPFVNVLCIIGLIGVIDHVLSKKGLGKKKLAGVALLTFIFYKNVAFSIESQPYPNYNDRYSQAFRTNIKSAMSAFSKKALIGYSSVSRFKKYNYPLFAKWSFLDFLGYDNLVELPRNGQDVAQVTRDSKQSIGSLSGATLNVDSLRWAFIRTTQIKVVVTDSPASFIPRGSIKSTLADELSHERVYILKQNGF